MKTSMEMKVLKIYYKGTCQEISAADGTEENEIFLMMKRIFRIKENIEDFFLQDSEGRIVILPKHLPNELSLFLYVRPLFDDSLYTFLSRKGESESESLDRLTPLLYAVMNADKHIIDLLLKGPGPFN